MMMTNPISVCEKKDEFFSGLRRACLPDDAALVPLPGTPRGSATHEAVRERPAEGFVLGTSPARDSWEA